MSASLSGAIALYIQYLRATGRAQTSAHVIESVLHSFQRFAGDVSVEEAVDEAIPFLADVAENHHRNTLATYFSYLRPFFAYCVQQGWLARNPLADMKGPRREVVVTQPLTDHEILTIYEVGDEWDRAMVTLLLGSGMRIGELATLRWRDIQGTQVVVHGKGAKQRTLAPGRQAMFALGGLPHDGEWVFPMTLYGIKERMRRLRARSGVAFHAHQFRHTFSDRYLRAGGTIETLSSLLGHASLETTAVYIAQFRRDMALQSQLRYNPADALFTSERVRAS